MKLKDLPKGAEFVTVGEVVSNPNVWTLISHSPVVAQEWERYGEMDAEPFCAPVNSYAASIANCPSGMLVVAKRKA